jgi:hypothetical protein
MLYRRGRPTSVVLLLLMVIPKLSLSLSCHSPLGLHHLLRFVGAARGLVTLGGVKVLQVRLVVVSALLAEVGGRVWSRSSAGAHARILDNVSRTDSLGEGRASSR